MFNTLYTQTTYYYKNYNNYTDWLILGTLFTLSVNQWALTLTQKNTILTFSLQYWSDLLLFCAVVK